MDIEKLKQFLLPIIIFVAAIVALAFFGGKIIQNFQDYKVVRGEVENNKIQLSDKRKQLIEKKKEAAAEVQKEKTVRQEAKAFYKPIESGLDNEAVIAGEFAEILQLIRANQIKVRSIKYDYNPSDDNFVKGNAGRYNVARLNMEMIGNYTNYDHFLRELYKHEHFLDIQSVEIVPYRKDKRILLINFKLKLYSKR
ncbi:hypothetical protein IJ596_06150 [bacterium]|nr:hypothetical protein [bacterium]